MEDPLTMKEKLKDPEYNNWVKAVLIMRELKIGISPFIMVRCMEVQEAILQTVLKNNLPAHVKTVPQCTTCKRDTVKSKACPEKVCTFILKEIKKIHKSKRIELSCTDVSAWTNTSGYWEIARAFMGKEKEERKSTKADDTDCTGLLSIIINCMPIHKFLTMDMERKGTVFKKVKNIRDDVMHSPHSLLSNAPLQHLIKACVQILDEPKILAVAAKERIKEIEGMLLTVSNVDYTSVFLEVQENQRREISEMKTNVAVLAGKQAAQDKNMTDLAGKQAAQDKKQAAQDKNISDLKQAAQDKKQSAQDTNISDLAGKQALQGYELQVKRKSEGGGQWKAEKRAMSTEEEAGAAELKADILKGYQKDLATVLETSLYDGVSAIHMFSPIIIREDLENQFSDNSPDRQGTSAAAASLISQHSGKVKSIKSYRDIFFKDGQLQRRIVLLGEAGIGKTTFCNHIVNLWCRVQTDDCQRDLTEPDQALIDVLKQFEHLFVVRCRDTKDHTSVRGMVKEMFCSEEVEKHIDTIFRLKTKQCLVIIDGLDESLYTSSVGRGIDSQSEILGATIIMTSRPWMVEALKRDSLLGYRVFQLEGLDWRGVMNLTQKFIEALKPSGTDHEQLCKNFLTQVRLQEMEDIVKQPLLLFSIIKSWLSRNQKLHRSLTMNYAGLINSVLSHSYTKLSDKDKTLAKRQEKESLPGCFTEMETCLTLSGIIRKISDLAFKTLVLKAKEMALVFSKKDLIDEVGEDCLDLCLKLGILSETKASSLARVKHVTISFIHKSVQEYFASLHLSEDESGDCLTEFTDKLTSLNEVFDLALILNFLFGMSPSKGQTVLKHVNGVSDQCSEIKAYRRQCPGLEPLSISLIPGVNCILRLNQLYVRCDIELNNTVVSPTSQDTSIQSNLYIPDVLIDELFSTDDKVNLLFCPGEHIKSLAYITAITPCDVVESLESMTNLEKLVLFLSSKDHLDKHIDLIIQSLPHLQQLQSFKITIGLERLVPRNTYYMFLQEREPYRLSVLQTKSLLTELGKLTNLVSVALSCLDLATVEKVEFPTNLHSVLLSNMNVTSELFACLPSSCTACRIEYLNCTGDLVFPSTCTELYCREVSCTGALKFPSTYSRLDCCDVSVTGGLVFPSTCTTLYCREVSCTGNLEFPSTCTTLNCRDVSYTGTLVFPLVCTELDLDDMSLPELSVLPANITSLEIRDVTLTQAAAEQLCSGLRSISTLQSLSLCGSLVPDHLDLTSCLSLHTLELENIELDNCGVVVPQNVRKIRMISVTLSQQYWDQLVHNIYTCHNVRVILDNVTINEATLKYIRQHFFVTYEDSDLTDEGDWTDEEEAYRRDEENDSRTDEENDRTDEENDRTDEENDRTDENNDRTDKENDRTDEGNNRTGEENDRTDEENDRTDEENDRTDEENNRTDEENDRTDEENDRTDEENDRTDDKNSERIGEKNSERTGEKNSERTGEKNSERTGEKNSERTYETYNNIAYKLHFRTKCPEDDSTNLPE